MLAATKMNADQRVLLVDADLQNNAQSAAFFSDAFMSAYGMPQGPFDACFGQIPFWMVTPNSAEHGSDARFVSLHTSMGGRLALTHFHWELVKPGQNVMIRAVRDYWHNLRANFSYAFVDIPAFDRANLKEEICAEADTTLLVSDQSDHHSTGIKSLYDELNASGAHCAGLVINALPVYAAFSGDAP